MQTSASYTGTLGMMCDLFGIDIFMIMEESIWDPCILEFCNTFAFYNRYSKNMKSWTGNFIRIDWFAQEAIRTKQMFVWMISSKACGMMNKKILGFNATYQI